MLRNLSLAFCLALVLGACGKDLGEKKSSESGADLES